jgi:hypothetical protein
MKSILRLLRVPAMVFLAALTAYAQPANDNFANAWLLSGISVSTNGSNALATKETGEPNHAGNLGGRSVWFNWTAPVNGQTRIDTLDSSFNTLLAVYTGNSVGALTVVASNNTLPGLPGGASLLEFTAAAGTTYRIAVDANRGFGVPAGGNYALRLQVLASINIISPANNTVVYTGNPIVLEADGFVANPPITRMDFYRGNTLVGSESNPPYSISLLEAPLGTNRFTAVAVDSLGIGWTSSVVNVPHLDLGATILSPVQGAVFINTNPIVISAVNSLPSGAVTLVEFFVDGQKIGQASGSPFSATWSNVVGGVHRLTAVSWDQADNSYTSSPVTISVPRLLIPTGSVWKYLDDGSDQGTAWAAPDYDDSSWASGPAELGYGDGDEATVVSFGPDPNNKHITTYFRHAFLLQNAAAYSNLIFNVKRDDGAVVYLNGQEVQRMNMPFGPINYQTRASLAGDDGKSFYLSIVPPTFLVDGWNVLAVEIHQHLPDDDDISFDLQLQGVFHPRNEPPLVNLISPTHEEHFLAPSSITLSAGAFDLDGEVERISFYANGVLLGSVTELPYNLVWQNPPVGRYRIRAVATDDLETSAVSEEIAITVYDAAGTPFAQITTPTNGTVLEGPITIPVVAEAFAPSGVTSVRFLANGALIGEAAANPYHVSWEAPFGTNELIAVATDQSGVHGTSAVVTVTITVPPVNTVAPTIFSRSPPAGVTLTTLSTIRVTFSERVSGVDASDLLVNGVPATQVSGSGSNYTFTVVEPGYGLVNITWAAGHGIQDFGWPSALPFDENGPGARWTYNFVDRTPPTIVTRIPAAGSALTNLTEISLVFSEPVAGVDAADLLVNGVPALAVEGAGTSYTFTAPQVGSGLVNISWAIGHGITDLATSPNAFNATAAGATWSYIIDENIPPEIASIQPAPGAHVLNLTEVTVTFSEPVKGVDARDLLVNGLPAASMSGAGATYTFRFPQMHTNQVFFLWADGHGITDLAPSANPFDATDPGAAWFYTTMDNLPPSASIHPPPSATVRRLAEITVTFNEPVEGVDAADLLINGIPAAQVSGSGAGPYLFSFDPAAAGRVELAFVSGHGIQDLATPPNPFAGHEWTYVVNPDLVTEMAVAYVVQISIDGLGSNHLDNYLRNAPAQFPNFVRLTQEGAYTLNARCDYYISETIPNHACMFTGRPSLQPEGFADTIHHGYSSNFPGANDTFHAQGNANVPYFYSMFDVAHDYGLSTAFYTGKTRMAICERSYNAIHGAEDLIGEDNGRNKIDFSLIADISGNSITNQVNTIVANLSSQNPRHYSFIHIAEPDITGHLTSWGSTSYSNMVRLVDAQLGRILNAIDNNPLMANQTAVILTTDHGGGGVTLNHHMEAYHIDNYTIPFFLRAPGIPGGVDLYTLLANRGDPGTNRTDYTTIPQPIRNGDGSNLALTLLALPPIPGSYMVPVFGSPAVVLHVARFEGRVGVFWADPDDEYLLEAASDLSSAEWEPITLGITTQETTKVFTITDADENSPRFFRLRKRK